MFKSKWTAEGLWKGKFCLVCGCQSELLAELNSSVLSVFVYSTWICALEQLLLMGAWRWKRAGGGIQEFPVAVAPAAAPAPTAAQPNTSPEPWLSPRCSRGVGSSANQSKSKAGGVLMLQREEQGALTKKRHLCLQHTPPSFASCWF